MIETWRKCWRDGFAKVLSPKALSALRNALEADDPRLCQGATVLPHPQSHEDDTAPTEACAVGLCGWDGEGMETVSEVEAFFAGVCFEVDNRLGEPAGCRYLLNWVDETPRPLMRAELLGEVNLALAGRKAGAA